MRSLFEIGVRLIGMSILTGAIDPLTSLVLSSSVHSQPGQVLLTHNLALLLLRLLVGFMFLTRATAIAHAVRIPDTAPPTNASWSSFELLRIGFVLVGLFYLLPAITDVISGIYYLYNPLSPHGLHFSTWYILGGSVRGGLAILLITISRQLAARMGE
jgi:hypothetical protein